MQSYLTNRKQKVRIDQRESKPITITMGVSQGTILLPLLFIITWKEVESEMNQLLEKKIAANLLALSFFKLYLIIPLINFYFQYLKFNTLFSTDRLCYILFFIIF